MANTRTVGATGANHTTIAAAISWFQINHNFTTDGIATLQIIDSANYAENVNITGIAGITSHTAHLKFTVLDSQRGKTGAWDVTKARISGAGTGHRFTLSESFTVIENIQIYQDGGGTSDECIRVAGGNCLISRCILRGANTSHQDGVYPQSIFGLYVDHCVFVDCYRVGLHDQGANAVTYSDHNTFINCGSMPAAGEAFGGIGGKTTSATFHVYNNLGINSSDGSAQFAFNEYGSSPTWNGSHNISAQDSGDNSAISRFGATNNWGDVDVEDSATAPTSGEWIWINDDTTSPFDVSIQNENAFTVTGNGTSRVGSEPDPRQDFSIDFAGNARHATTPDIGAFEFVAAGGTTVTAGLSTETDSALSTTTLKTLTAGLVTETESSLSTNPERIYATNFATESNSAFGVSIDHALSANLANETESSLSTQPQRTKTIGLSAETDSSLSVSATGAIVIGQASEAETSQTVSISKNFTIAQSQETDTALSVTGQRTYSAGQSVEVDSSFAITLGNAVAAGLVSESDAALSISMLREYDIGISTETDSSLNASTTEQSSRRVNQGNKVLVTSRAHNSVLITSRKYNQVTIQ